MTTATLERTLPVGTFFNEQIADKYPEVKKAIVHRFAGNDYASMTVTATERQPNGWLEWAIFIEYKDGGSIFIAAIQRKPGDDVEFHS